MTGPTGRPARSTSADADTSRPRATTARHHQGRRGQLPPTGDNGTPPPVPTRTVPAHGQQPPTTTSTNADTSRPRAGTARHHQGRRGHFPPTGNNGTPPPGPTRTAPAHGRGQRPGISPTERPARRRRPRPTRTHARRRGRSYSSVHAEHGVSPPRKSIPTEEASPRPAATPSAHPRKGRGPDVRAGVPTSIAGPIPRQRPGPIPPTETRPAGSRPETQRGSRRSMASTTWPTACGSRITE